MWNASLLDFFLHFFQQCLNFARLCWCKYDAIKVFILLGGFFSTFCWKWFTCNCFVVCWGHNHCVIIWRILWLYVLICKGHVDRLFLLLLCLVSMLTVLTWCRLLNYKLPLSRSSKPVYLNLPSINNRNMKWSFFQLLFSLLCHHNTIALPYDFLIIIYKSMESCGMYLTCKHCERQTLHHVIVYHL